MPTGQTIANNVLTDIGVMRPGTTPNSADSADVLAVLNVLVDEWSAENALVYAVGTAQYILVANQASYLIGSGAADFNTTRPSRIERAVIVSTVGSAKSRAPLRLVSEAEYFAHRDLATAGSSPEELYDDYAAPVSTLYLFPAPTVPTATKLELETWTQLTQFADLVTSYFLPPGYQGAIQFELGFRLLSHFKVTDETIIAKTERLAINAASRIRELNVQNRLLDPSVLAALRPQPRVVQAQPQVIA